MMTTILDAKTGKTLETGARLTGMLEGEGDDGSPVLARKLPDGRWACAQPEDDGALWIALR